jgi:hypothetical protein
MELIPHNTQLKLHRVSVSQFVPQPVGGLDRRLRVFPPSVLSCCHPHILYLVRLQYVFETQTCKICQRVLVDTRGHTESVSSVDRYWVCLHCHQFRNKQCIVCVVCQSLELHQELGMSWLRQESTITLDPFLPNVLIQDILSYTNDIPVPEPPRYTGLDYWYWYHNPSIVARYVRGRLSQGEELVCIGLLAIWYVVLIVLGVWPSASSQAKWCFVTGIFGFASHVMGIPLLRLLYVRMVDQHQYRYADCLYMLHDVYLFTVLLFIPVILFVTGWIQCSRDGTTPLVYAVIGCTCLFAASLWCLNILACGIRIWIDIVHRGCRCSRLSCTCSDKYI